MEQKNEPAEESTRPKPVLDERDMSKKTELTRAQVVLLLNCPGYLDDESARQVLEQLLSTMG